MAHTTQKSVQTNLATIFGITRKPYNQKIAIDIYYNERSIIRQVHWTKSMNFNNQIKNQKKGI